VRECPSSNTTANKAKLLAFQMILLKTKKYPALFGEMAARGGAIKAFTPQITEWGEGPSRVPFHVCRSTNSNHSKHDGRNDAPKTPSKGQFTLSHTHTHNQPHQRHYL
jgi:hypothetical protein